MNCKYCGAEMRSNTKFCIKCGKNNEDAPEKTRLVNQGNIGQNGTVSKEKAAGKKFFRHKIVLIPVIAAILAVLAIVVIAMLPQNPQASYADGTYKECISVSFSTAKVFPLAKDADVYISLDDSEYTLYSGEEYYLDQFGTYSFKLYTVNSAGIKSPEQVFEYIMEVPEPAESQVSIEPEAYTDNQNEEITDWKQEYIGVIETWHQESKDDILGYDFVYLNNDDIPELILYCNDGAYYGFDVYSIVDEKAARLELYDFNGEKEETTLTSDGRQGQSDSYIYKKGILMEQGGMMGSYNQKGYLYREGRLEQIFKYSYIDNAAALGTDENIPIYYQIKYVTPNGEMEEIRKEEDVDFESCPEARVIEDEYGISFSELEYFDPLAEQLLTYDDAVRFLQSDGQ